MKSEERKTRRQEEKQDILETLRLRSNAGRTTKRPLEWWE